MYFDHPYPSIEGITSNTQCECHSVGLLKLSWYIAKQYINNHGPKYDICNILINMQTNLMVYGQEVLTLVLCTVLPYKNACKVQNISTPGYSKKQMLKPESYYRKTYHCAGGRLTLSSLRLP